MLWDDPGGRLVVADLEDVKWLKRPQALKPASGNAQRGHRVKAGTKAKIPGQLNYLHMTSPGPWLSLIR